MDGPRFAGVEIDFAGEKLIVPPIAVGKLRTLLEKLPATTLEIGGIPTAEQFETGLQFVLAAVQRNYPDKRMDWLEEVLDMGNFAAAMAAVYAVSGLVKPVGEAAPGAV